MEPDDLDATFFALASDLRRRMLDVLKREGGCNVNRLCEEFSAEVGRHAVMKHLAVLERGGLLVTAKDGRDKRLWFDPTPLQLIHERWTTEFSAYWAARLTRAEVRRGRRRGPRPARTHGFITHEDTQAWLTTSEPKTRCSASSSRPTSSGCGAN
jgi:DNA-binding transcriptional ArsR family regulator